MAEQIEIEAARRGVAIDLYVVMLLSRALARPDPLLASESLDVR